MSASIELCSKPCFSTVSFSLIAANVPRLRKEIWYVPEHLLAAVHDPVVNLILTGSKTMTVGNRTLEYDPASYFVMSVDLPAVGSVHPAATGESYLAVSLTLDPAIVAALIRDLPMQVCRTLFDSGFSVAPVTRELLDAWIRMLRLMARPDEIAVLSPGYEREILFRVPQGPLGWRLRDIASPDTALSRIGVAINWIRGNFTEVVYRFDTPSERNEGAGDTANTRDTSDTGAGGAAEAAADSVAQKPFALGPVNLTITRGETLFIVGENGCGKTTLIKLLLGLYSPNQGNVKLDDHVIDDDRLDEYRQLFSAVFSDH